MGCYAPYFSLNQLLASFVLYLLYRKTTWSITKNVSISSLLHSKIAPVTQVSPRHHRIYAPQAAAGTTAYPPHRPISSSLHSFCTNIQERWYQCQKGSQSAPRFIRFVPIRTSERTRSCFSPSQSAPRFIRFVLGALTLLILLVRKSQSAPRFIRFVHNSHQPLRYLPRPRKVSISSSLHSFCT